MTSTAPSNGTLSEVRAAERDDIFLLPESRAVEVLEQARAVRGLALELSGLLTGKIAAGEPGDAPKPSGGGCIGVILDTLDQMSGALNTAYSELEDLLRRKEPTP